MLFPILVPSRQKRPVPSLKNLKNQRAQDDKRLMYTVLLRRRMHAAQTPTPVSFFSRPVRRSRASGRIAPPFQFFLSSAPLGYPCF